ncbi:hypothetical protein EDB83DRAFT_2555559 [Lactarius deliciosus]|nr:hypothetical protein EDB83DRAFT_2555559 [Lactarius deliciosus]
MIGNDSDEAEYTAYHLSERRRLACWAINTLHMDSPHNLSGCSMRASVQEGCCVGVPNDWELEEERALKIIGPPGHVRWKCCRKEFDVLVGVTFVYSSFGSHWGKKNNKLRRPPLCERPANVGKWQKPDHSRTKLHRRRLVPVLYLSYESPSPEIASQIFPPTDQPVFVPRSNENYHSRHVSSEFLTDQPLLHDLASPGLTARPPGNIDLGIGNYPGVGNYMCGSSAFDDALREDPATFMVSPTADELLAANSMQENDDPLSIINETDLDSQVGSVTRDVAEKPTMGTPNPSMHNFEIPNASLGRLTTSLRRNNADAERARRRRALRVVRGEWAWPAVVPVDGEGKARGEWLCGTSWHICWFVIRAGGHALVAAQERRREP